MKTENNKMYFVNDDEFTDFCLCKDYEVFHDDITNLDYYDFPYTYAYDDAVKNNMVFIIEDPNSKITKRGCVCRGFITKKVSNLER